MFFKPLNRQLSSFSFGSRYSLKVVSIVIVGLMIRLMSLKSELPPFVFCDEKILLEEVLRMYHDNSWATKVFISGPINIYPILLLIKILSFFGFSITETNVLILGRATLTLGIYVVSSIVLYKLSILLNPSRGIACITVLLYSFMPYSISQNRLWYPDHYSSFFHICITYALILSLRKFSIVNNLKIGFFLGVGVSLKFTLIFSVLPVIYIYALKYFEKRSSTSYICKSIMAFFFGFSITFILFNISAFLSPYLFYNQMNFNADLYQTSPNFSIGTYLFYPLIIFFISTSFIGFVPLIWGFTQQSKREIEVLVILLLPICIQVLIMGKSDHLINRNINQFTPTIYFLMALGLCSLYKRSKLISLLIGFILLIYAAFQTFQFARTELMPSSYLLTADWLKVNVPAEELIGANWSCGALSPADLYFNTSLVSPKDSNNVEYFVFSSYWGSPFDSYYRNKNLLQETQLKNLHYYHYDDKGVFNFRWHRPSIESLVPPGYRIIKIVQGNGPDFIILRRQVLGD